MLHADLTKQFIDGKFVAGEGAEESIVNPATGAVIARAREEVGEKRPCGGVEIEMMGEYSRRFRGVAYAGAPRLEMQDQPIDGGVDTDESAVAPPGDQIDVRIALHQAGTRMHPCARPEGGQAGKSRFGQSGDHQRVDAIPGRHQHGAATRAETRSQAGAP